MNDEGNLFQNSINDAKSQLKEIFDSYAKSIASNIDIGDVFDKNDIRHPDYFKFL